MSRKPFLRREGKSEVRKRPCSASEVGKEAWWRVPYGTERGREGQSHRGPPHNWESRFHRVPEGGVGSHPSIIWICMAWEIPLPPRVAGSLNAGSRDYALRVLKRKWRGEGEKEGRRESPWGLRPRLGGARGLPWLSEFLAFSTRCDLGWPQPAMAWSRARVPSQRTRLDCGSESTR